MTVCFTSYAVLVGLATVAKALSPDFAAYIEGLFFLAVLGTMWLVYTQVLNERCGQSSAGTVFTAMLPWIFMLGGSMVALKVFPGWIQPFSNTFGYLLVNIPIFNATDKLIAILAEGHQTSVELIQNNPRLMLNEFSSSGFDASMEKMQAEGLVRPGDHSDFRQIIAGKDAVAAGIWYLLVGSVAITTAFNVLMNFTCQKVEMKDAPMEAPVEETTEYVIED